MRNSRVIRRILIDERPHDMITMKLVESPCDPQRFIPKGGLPCRVRRTVGREESEHRSAIAALPEAGQTPRAQPGSTQGSGCASHASRPPQTTAPRSSDRLPWKCVIPVCYSDVVRTHNVSFNLSPLGPRWPEGFFCRHIEDLRNPCNPRGAGGELLVRPRRHTPQKLYFFVFFLEFTRTHV